MRSPISFKEWYHIIGVVFLIGAIFLLLKQLPFINELLEIINDYLEIHD